MVSPMQSRTAILLIILAGSPSIAQKRIATNEQVVIESFREAALKSNCCADIGSMRLDVAESGLERPISSGLIEAFRSRGIAVVSGAGESSVKIGYNILGFDFAYKKGKSRGFMRKPMIKRVLEARIRMTVTRLMDGVIVGQEDIFAGYNGEIDPEAVNFVKSVDIPALAPNPPGSGWARIVEPIVVTAAVGGLVYLFFANR